MPLLGFSIGSSDNGDVGRSLDDIIADRRKEQARAMSGRPSNNNKQSGNNTKNAKDKKTALADKSIATGRAKRAAAIRAKRGLGDKKASAMEIEKEVYRQSRKTASAKKASEKKATNGRVPPNSSLREKKKKNNNTNNDPPGALVGKMPQAKQVKAAIQGMELAGCPVPKGFQLVMQFTPIVAANEKGKGKQQPNANNNNKKNNNNNNKNSNNSNNTGNQKAGGRRKSGGRGRNN